MFCLRTFELFLKGLVKEGETVKRILSITAIGVFLVAFVGGMAYAGDTQLPMVGSQWKVYEENTLPSGLHFYPATHATTVASGVEFEMPDASGLSPTYVNYLLDNYTASLTEDDAITAVIDVDTSSGDVSFIGNPSGKCGTGANCPGSVRLLIESNLPTGNGNAPCVGPGLNQDNYWWSNPTDYVFVQGPSGDVTLQVSLDPGDWSNVCGKDGTADSAGFGAAIKDIKYLGLSFGSGSRYANGLGVNGTNVGTAEFKLESFTITTP
jgi:hypothetical protein